MQCKLNAAIRSLFNMATTITELLIDADREREMAEARVELLRRAEAHGVKPISSLKDLAGDPEMTADFDVDEFLRQVREDRDRPSTRSME